MIELLQQNMIYFNFNKLELVILKLTETKAYGSKKHESNHPRSALVKPFIASKSDLIWKTKNKKQHKNK